MAKTMSDEDAVQIDIIRDAVDLYLQNNKIPKINEKTTQVTMSAVITLIILMLEVFLILSYAWAGYPEHMTTNFFIVQSILLPILTRCITDYIKLTKQEQQQATELYNQAISKLPLNKQEEEG